MLVSGCSRDIGVGWPGAIWMGFYCGLQLSFGCQVIPRLPSLSDRSRWVYSRPAPPSWHGKYEVSIFVSTVLTVWRCLGGCHSQGCHEYPSRLARIDTGLHLAYFRHHSPSSSIVDEFKNIFMVARWRDNKCEFFAYVTSRKQKANQREKLQGGVFLFNSKPHAKIQALLKKKEKTQNCHLAPFCTHPFNCEARTLKILMTNCPYETSLRCIMAVVFIIRNIQSKEMNTGNMMQVQRRRNMPTDAKIQQKIVEWGAQP